jgi:hypothetical protein
MQCAQRLLFAGPIAVLFLTSVTRARAQTNDYEFNDSMGSMRYGSRIFTS